MVSRRWGECTYCGSVGPLSVDHVPPRCLFGSPTPNDLIKVPACLLCNQGASKDDEYLKTMLVLKDRAGDHPEALAVRPGVFRSLEMPEKLGLRIAIARTLRKVSAHTRGGLYLGHRQAYSIDIKRFDRVVVRIIRGLHWKLRGNRVPESCGVYSFSEDGFESLTRAERAEVRRDFVDPIYRQPRIELGRGGFAYRVLWNGPETAESGWIFEFYGDVRFGGLITGEGVDLSQLPDD